MNVRLGGFECGGCEDCNGCASFWFVSRRDSCVLMRMEIRDVEMSVLGIIGDVAFFYLLFLIENRGCLQLMCILVYLLTANAMNFTSDIVEKKGEIECLV